MNPFRLVRFALAAAARPSVRSLLTSAAVLLVANQAHAVPVTVPVQLDVDTWVQNGSASANAGAPSLVANGSAGAEKNIYLRFTVKPSHVNASKPSSAKLKLNKTSGMTAAVKSLDVHAANNGWAAGINWSQRPATTDIGGAPLDSIDTSVTGPGWLTFDVTPYISGPGTYTFCITTTALSDLSFKSAEEGTGSNAPVLEVTRDDVDAYFERTVLQVLAAGRDYRARYVAANGTAGSNDINLVGYFDVTKPPYAMKASGGNATDNTLALQRAVNEARDARVAVFIPAGTYAINDRIDLIQGLVPFQSDALKTHGERWDINDFPCILLGNPDPNPANRTKLVLANGAAGFNVTPAVDNLKTVLNFMSRSDQGAPQENRLAAHFNQTLANIDLDLGTNASAVGVDLAGAQGSSLRDVTITATNAFAGIRGLPGPGGTTENLTVTGGQYGVYCAGDKPGNLGFTALISGSVFSGQTVNAVRFDGEQGLVLVGCEITFGGGASAVPIASQAGGARAGNICLIDTRIERTASTGPLVGGNRSVYLRDVYAARANPIASVEGLSGTKPAGVAANGTGWAHIHEYWDGVKLVQFTGEASAYVPTHVDQVLKSANGATPSISPSIAESDIPDDLRTRHVAPLLPRWDAPNVMNLRTHPTWIVTSDGDGAGTDQWQKIQNIINDAANNNQALFVPAGEYSVLRPLSIPNNLVVFGLDKSLSRLKALSGFKDPATSSTAYDPLVRVGVGDASDAGATTVIAHLMLFVRMDEAKCYLLDWQTGRNSAVMNVNFDRRNVGVAGGMGVPLVLVHGEGGGRWYGFWNDSDANQTTGYRHLKVAGTTEPLRFYMLNAETDTNVHNVEFDTVKNVDMYQSKWEGDGLGGSGGPGRTVPILRVHGSTDVRLFSFGGNAFMNTSSTSTRNTLIQVTSSDRFLLAMQLFQINGASTGKVYDWLQDGTFGLDRKKQEVVYRIDEPRSSHGPVSIGAQDGWMLSDGTSGTGASGPNALIVGDAAGSTNLRYRAMLSFSTQSIPANATIQSARLRLRLGTKTGTIPAAFGNFVADIRKGAFGTDTTLTGDFNATPTAPNVISVAPPSALGWHEFTLSAAGLAAIEKGGLTQIRLSFANGSNGDGTAQSLGFYSGDHSDPENRPMLDITYTVP